MFARRLMCSKGLHDLSRPGAIIHYPSERWPRCYQCRQVSAGAARRRHEATAKGMLTQSRYKARQRAG